MSGRGPASIAAQGGREAARGANRKSGRGGVPVGFVGIARAVSARLDNGVLPALPGEEGADAGPAVLRPARLATIAAPTLALWGTQDALVREDPDQSGLRAALAAARPYIVTTSLRPGDVGMLAASQRELVTVAYRNGLGISTETRELWRLETPCRVLRVEQLKWHIDYPFCSSDPPAPLFDLMPRAVLEDPNKFPRHLRRMLEADLSFPIHVSTFGERWVILDGIHRLLKSLALDIPVMECKLVPRERLRVAA